MASVMDFPARGKVIGSEGNTVIFAPAGTRYEWYLEHAGAYAGPMNEPVEGYVRVQARKVMTVPSGGNFMEPITGTPRTVQGRVRYADEKQLVIYCGTWIVVDLPANDMKIDLNDGSLAVGKMVNVMAMPGARFELARQTADMK